MHCSDVEVVSKAADTAMIKIPNFMCLEASADGRARGSRVEVARASFSAIPVKRHRGSWDTRDTRAQTGTRITQTNLTTIPTTHPHDHATAETAIPV